MQAPRPKAKTFYGYGEGRTPIAVAVVTTEEEREAARSILRGMSQGHEPVIESPDSPWLGTVAKNDYTQQLALEKLSHASERAGFRTEYAGPIPRGTLERFAGHVVTDQLLGRRPGVL